MTVDVNKFRQDFKEFTDTEMFPDPAVSFWLLWASKMINQQLYGDCYDLATELFVAHHLVIEALNTQSVVAGGLPGLPRGVIASESVDKNSINYDNSAVIDADAGHWALTTYGFRMRKLILAFGAVPLQIGAGPFVASPLSAPNAWPGPPIQGYDVSS